MGEAEAPPTKIASVAPMQQFAFRLRVTLTPRSTPACLLPPNADIATFTGRAALSLEVPHLTRRSRAPLRRFATDNPAHSRIVAQALGVVHILVSGKATKYRLPEQPGKCVPTILATACVGQNITRHLGQPEYLVEFRRISPWRGGRLMPVTIEPKRPDVSIARARTQKRTTVARAAPEEGPCWHDPEAMDFIPQ